MTVELGNINKGIPMGSYAPGEGGGGGTTKVTGVDPIAVTNGSVAIKIDEQTLQVNEQGELAANLDEIGNELNDLSGRVTAAEADILKKADKTDITFEASSPLTKGGYPFEMLGSLDTSDLSAVSGFSATSYLKMNSELDPWDISELRLSFKPSAYDEAYGTTHQCIWEGGGFFVYLRADQNVTDYIEIYNQTTGQNYDYSFPLYGFSASRFDIKCVRNGDGTVSYYRASSYSNSEPTVWTPLTEGNVTSNPDNKVCCVGNATWTTTPYYNSTIDFNRSYFKMTGSEQKFTFDNLLRLRHGEGLTVKNNVLVSTANTLVEAPLVKQKVTGMTVRGTSPIDSNGIMSGQDVDNCCKIPESYISVGNTFQFKITTPAEVGSQYQVINNFYDPCDLQIDYETGNISAWGLGGFTPIITSFEFNKDYWIRLKINSATSFTYNVSTNGTDYGDDITVSPDGTWYPNHRSYLGLQPQPNSDNMHIPFKGKIDLKECYVETADGTRYYMLPESLSKLALNIGTGLYVSDGMLMATGGGSTSVEKYGIEGDYSSKYGILECPNGIFTVSDMTMTLQPGVVMQCAGSESKTTNSSAMAHTVTATSDFDIFYTSGQFIEATQVVFSTEEPDDGDTGYIAWWDPSREDKKWQFKSNDTGNVWAAAPACRLAHVHTDGTSITRVDYIGNRQMDDGCFADLTGTNKFTGSNTFDNATIKYLTIKNAYDGSTLNASFGSSNANSMYFGIGNSQIGINHTAKRMYIAPAYGYSEIAINNYNDGSAESGIAAKVVISGPLKNKIDGVEYDVPNASQVWTLSHVGATKTALTWGASGSLYIAPGNGRFAVEYSSTNANEYIRFYHQKNDINRYGTGNPSSALTVDISVDKGDTVALYHNVSGYPLWFHFIPANGG